MPSIRSLQRSFAGGEISPEMYGRIDDTKYQAGLTRCRNFIAKAQGPVENRAGTAFVREVKTSAKAVRLIPFTYSTTQTMLIEMGEGYFRFHTFGATLLYTAPSAWAGAHDYAVGDLASNGGTNYYCLIAHTSGTFATDLSNGKWYALPASLIYEIPNPYAEADLFDIHYVQSADVLTLVHPNYAPRELRRLGATSWVLASISFAQTISAPTSVTGTASSGGRVRITGITKASAAVVKLKNEPTFSDGDTVYISGIKGMTQFVEGFYTVDSIYMDTFKPRYLDGQENVNSSSWSTYTGGGFCQIAMATTEVSNSYKVTAVGANGIDESSPSSAVVLDNNLYVTGASNTISWAAVSGAIRYNIYKEHNGLYGYIGQSDGTSFIDSNIAPDMSLTPPIVETVFNGTNEYPGAVSYFEQRKCFAGTNNEPQKIWMTRSGTESDMSYSLPITDDDRISFRVAAREANTIRHIIPLSQLLLLTSSAEWRVTSVNSDAITPTSISVRPQSYIGASNVQPVIVNNNLIYAAARGGHARECAYQWQANGFLSGDLSLRAAHLFDQYDIVDMAYSKAPYPIVWFVSSSGRLLGLTYVPEQQVGAWHWHDTANGVFESCAVVAEGAEDVLYVVVKRYINGSYYRYIERLVPRHFVNQADAFFVDCGLEYDGTNTAATTMTVTGGSTWGPGEELTITASAPSFAHPATTDVDDAIVLTDDAGNKYTITIQSTTSTSVAKGMVDKTIPASLRSTATTVWAFARGSFSGLGHLEGEVVNILADGAVAPQRTVTSGVVTLDAPAVKVRIGEPIVAEIETLPLVAQTDHAFGQGRMKNVNKAWLRVYRSSGIWVGPDEDNLREVKQRTTEPYGVAPAVKSEEIPLTLTPAWSDSGKVFIRQEDPLPLTIAALTLEVALGG